MTTGQRIKKARLKAGITQQELADRLGISYVGVSQWETDKRNPKLETLTRIAKALDVPASYLCGTISLRELKDEAAERHREAYFFQKNAKRANDEYAIKRWEQVICEIQAIKESLEVYSHGDLPEDTEKLVEMFDKLNRKGKKKVLELVSDFCKIGEYQAAPLQP